MSKQRGLGRGLSSLIPTDVSGSPSSGEGGGVGAELRELSVASISPNPHQPRAHFDEESLVELSASIAAMGVLQPVLVRAVGDAFELIAGERRWRAAQRAGLATIPAIIRTSDDMGSVEQALVENLHREDLTALEEAAAYQQLIEDFELTHDDVAQRVGKSRSAVTNMLRLLGLPPGVQALLADGQLSAGHARALLGTPDRAAQEQLARDAVANGWSVRATEAAVRGDVPGVSPGDGDGALPGDGASDPDVGTPDSGGSSGGDFDGAGLVPTTRLRPPGLLELEELLAEHLETRVSVTMSARRGRMSIEFADLEDLERIYRVMTGTA